MVGASCTAITAPCQLPGLYSGRLHRRRSRLPHLNFLSIAALSGVSFLAGLIDSIVGGGGLIQVPALLVALPGVPIPMVFGTNKLASICGTGTAVLRYRRSVGIRWARALPPAAMAFACSWLGARSVHFINPAVLRPLVLLLLVSVAVYTIFQRGFGERTTERPFRERDVFSSLAIGAVIGFYDGFFGPGTGSFLIFLFIGVLGLSFLEASAEAKVVNFSTNLAALVYFVASGNVLYALALPMGACNILGAVVGSKLAVDRGNHFIRGLFLVVITLVIGRYAWDTLQPMLQ